MSDNLSLMLAGWSFSSYCSKEISVSVKSNALPLKLSISLLKQL